MALTGVISGVSTTVNQLAANQMPDIDRHLYTLAPFQTPLWTKYFWSNKPSDVVYNANGRFDWMEDEYFPYLLNVTHLTGGSATGALTVTSYPTAGTIDASGVPIVGDVYLVSATQQLVYVTTKTATGTTPAYTLVVSTLNGSTLITDATTGLLMKVGSLNHEYGTPRTSAITQEIEKTNYCSIFKETVTYTGRQQAGKLYTNGKTFAEQIKKKELEMKQQFERNWWFSTANYTGLDSTSSYRVTFTQGFLGRISTNVATYTGDITEPVWDAFLAQCLTKGSADKDIYMGANIYNGVCKFVKDKYHVNDNEAKEYGVRTTSYIAPIGKRLTLIWNPQFEGAFSDSAFAVDPEGIRIRYMNNDEKGTRKFRIEEFEETNGIDGKSAQLLADLGIQIPNEETHGVLYKV
jgi:hypothetical protein